MFGLAEIRKQLEDHEVRIKVVERENETTKTLREARNSRREFWLVKMLPSISASIVAVLGLNAVFHWF